MFPCSHDNGITCLNLFHFNKQTKYNISKSASLNNFFCHYSNSFKSFFSQFSCNRSKYSFSQRFFVFSNQSNCIVIKTNISPIWSSNLFSRSYYYSPLHRCFCDLSRRSCAFYSNNDNISYRSNFSCRSLQYSDYLSCFCSCIICNNNIGFLLNHVNNV